MFKKLIPPEHKINQAAVITRAVESFVLPREPVARGSLLLSTVQSNVVPLHSEHFLSFNVCKKKFVLDRCLPVSELPKPEISDMVRMDDGVIFAEMVRKLHRVSYSQITPHVIKGDFESSAQTTSEIIRNYAKLRIDAMNQKEVATAKDDLVMYRPALSWRPRGYGTTIELRCRATIIHFSALSNKWSIIETKAATFNRDKSDFLKMGSMAEESLFVATALTKMIDQIIADPREKELLLGGKSSNLSSCIATNTSGVYHLSPNRPAHYTPLEFNLGHVKQLLTLVTYDELIPKAFGGITLSDKAAVMREAMSLAEKKMSELCRYATDSNFDTVTAPLMQREKISLQDFSRFFLNQNKDMKYLPKSSCGSHCTRGTTCQFYAPGFCLPPTADDPIADGDNWITTVPLLNLEVKFQLWNSGIRTLSQLAGLHAKGQMQLSPGQERYIRATVNRQIFVNPAAIKFWLQQLRYPIYFLDFECTQFAVPPYATLTSFEQLPFQFSLNVFQKDVLTENPRSFSFIALGSKFHPGEDPRPKVIEELAKLIQDARSDAIEAAENQQSSTSPSTGGVEKKKSGGKKNSKKKEEQAPKITPELVDLRDLRTAFCSTITKDMKKKITAGPHDGCIVAHFATYEKRVLQRLGNLSKEHKPMVDSLMFLDTMDLIKCGVLHPASHGSNSLKKVLPALCPHLKYDDLLSGVASRGDNVAALYREWRAEMGGHYLHVPRVGGGPRDYTLDDQVKLRARKWDEIAEALTEYCNLDTKGMWEIVRAAANLAKIADESGAEPDRDGWVALDESKVRKSTQ